MIFSRAASAALDVRQGLQDIKLAGTHQAGLMEECGKCFCLCILGGKLFKITKIIHIELNV